MALFIKNAILFFLVDVPAVWAIQRGLLARQAYRLYMLAWSGRTIPLAGSRVRILGGELLRGFSRWPSVFIVINLNVLVCLCFATLSVDADKEMRWERVSFRNITTLDMATSYELRNTIFPDTQGGRYDFSHSLLFRDTDREIRRVGRKMRRIRTTDLLRSTQRTWDQSMYQMLGSRITQAVRPIHKV